VLGGLDGHVLEMHIAVLNIEHALIVGDAPFVDDDGRSSSVDHEAVGIHEGEGIAEIDMKASPASNLMRC
jgi:hypothetical protein